MSETTSQLPPALSPIPDFSMYAMNASGDVYRVVAPTRGRNAGLTQKLKPVIHPRGHRWYVQMTDDTGKRYRISLRQLQQRVFGVETIS